MNAKMQLQTVITFVLSGLFIWWLAHSGLCTGLRELWIVNLCLHHRTPFCSNKVFGDKSIKMENNWNLENFFESIKRDQLFQLHLISSLFLRLQANKLLGDDVSPPGGTRVLLCHIL